jgi:hypothetical protein
VTASEPGTSSTSLSVWAAGDVRSLVATVTVARALRRQCGRQLSAAAALMMISHGNRATES